MSLKNGFNIVSIIWKEVRIRFLSDFFPCWFKITFCCRLLTSLFEALTIHQQLHCSEQQKDFLPLWFLYCIAAMNALLVLNASSNILIYLFAGQSFRSKFLQVFGIEAAMNQLSSAVRKKRWKDENNILCMLLANILNFSENPQKLTARWNQKPIFVKQSSKGRIELICCYGCCLY